MVFNSPPGSITPVSITTASLPGAVVGTSYSAQLAATGGSGHYSWSISSDSLPAGLSLNTTTGLISGTPTKSGSLAFVVTATDSGPPSQHANGSFSISVSGAKPRPRLVRLTLVGAKISATVICTGQTTANCVGALKLTTLEHLVGPKVTAVSARATPKKP